MQCNAKSLAVVCTKCRVDQRSSSDWQTYSSFRLYILIKSNRDRFKCHRCCRMRRRKKRGNENKKPKEKKCYNRRIHFCCQLITTNTQFPIEIGIKRNCNSSINHMNC